MGYSGGGLQEGVIVAVGGCVIGGGRNSDIAVSRVNVLHGHW